MINDYNWAPLGTEQAPQFPVEHLPADCAALVQHVSACCAFPVDYAVCALQGTASAALVGRVIVDVNGEHTEPALLYLGMAGESGTRKSKALKYFMTPLRNWLRENCGESIRDDVTPEGLVSLMARQNGRGILYADEASIIDVLTGAMYSSKGSRPNLNVFLNAYDGSPVLVERSTMDCPEIPEAFLTITIGLQPGVQKRFAKDPESADRGLTQRFLFFWPDTIVSPGVRDLPKPDLTLKEAWAEKITVLASKFRDKSLTMGLSAEAYELYADHSDCMLRRTLEDLGANIATKSFARKAAGKSIRLAALLALLADPEAVEIDERSMRSAVTIMEGYFVPQAKRIFDSAGRLSPQAEAVLVAAKAMAATNALPLAEAELKHKVDGQQQFRGSSGNDAFLKALGELEAQGMMRKLPSEKSTKGGRPSRGKWDINPALLA